MSKCVDPAVYPPLLLTKKTAAFQLNVSVRHLERMMATNRTPEPVRLGDRVMFVRVEFEKWVEAGMPDRVTWNREKEALS